MDMPVSVWTSNHRFFLVKRDKKEVDTGCKTQQKLECSCNSTVSLDIDYRQTLLTVYCNTTIYRIKVVCSPKIKEKNSKEG